MDIWLSFKTITRFDFNLAALFNASNAIPPDSAPSPITAKTLLFSFLRSLAFAIPRARLIEVELCPVSNASQSLSLLFGNPLIPPNCLNVSKPAFLPVSSLCV